ncbi:S-adenosyl-L-methionine-dependent methyltransferase [Ophiobolus disseminans]|uniref:Histone-lysine N-methyltransferase, H3 lysine-79 specific n=1 Tax=Ophiobolus disseminans TaxID=1469910 RepID=A0A6A6ZIH8_9PLEO|nr:S-adenosyl-L-methionine-dependent methyltransferase [Ophiobolus disseminans]
MQKMRRPRQCPYCEYLSASDNIARHIRTTHDAPPLGRPEPTGERVLCQRCDPPRDVSKANISRHERSVHKSLTMTKKLPWKYNKTAPLAADPLLQYAASQLQLNTPPSDPPQSTPREVLLRHQRDSSISPESGLERQALATLITRLLFAEVVHPHTRRIVSAPDPLHVYGELNFSFVSRLLTEFSISRASTVVDLGSGVGNVVLQAVLETGCHALGCEVVKDRHTVAESFSQQGIEWASTFSGEFGDLQGRIELRHADAFTDIPTLTALRIANLVICNNFKFPPELLNRQVSAVLAQIKPGAVFVSLQRIVRGRASTRKQVLEDVGVWEERCEGREGDVSWRGGGVEYWVYRKGGVGVGAVDPMLADG